MTTRRFNNYNTGALAPVLIVRDPVALNKAFYPDTAKTTYSIGATVTYRLTLALSEGTVQGVTLTDSLPDGLTFLDATLGAGNLGITSGYGGSRSKAGNC